jgi:hypothetical protein
LNPPLYKTEPNVIGQYYSWYGPAITVDANDFKLSGFTINTPGTSDKAGGGIVITGNRTQIADNIIISRVSVNGSNYNIAENTFSGDINLLGNHSIFAGNDFTGGIWVFGSYLNISANNKASSSKVGTVDSGIRLEGSFCLVHDNTIKAIYLDPSIGVSGDGNIIANNVLDGSDVGIAISGSDNCIYSNRITNCRDNSFVPGYPPPISGIAIRVSGNNQFYANYIADNTWGADVNSFPKNNLTSTFSHNNFVGNLHQVAAVSGFPYGLDSFDNDREGNYWSDYQGADADGDGIGDSPYVIDDNRSDRYPLMEPFDIANVTVELPEWASPPSVRLISPENTTYTSGNVILNFTVNKQTTWIGYSLDGQENVTVTGNTTIAGVSLGLHNLTVYARDSLENMGNSNMVWFSVAEPFPTTLIVASVITVATVSVIVLVYFKKRKH